MASSNSTLSMNRIVLFALYIIAITILVYYIYDGYDYYITPFMERPHHPDHQNLKPGGIRGHGLGIIGTIMMLTILVYSMRKRNIIFSGIGQLGSWLDLHIFMGIMGPLFVILHTSLKLNGIVAISFWSMILVSLSGFLGRYLYLQIPRNISGHEIDLQELESTNENILKEIEGKYDIERSFISEMETLIVGKLYPDKSEFATFFSFLKADIFRLFRIRNIRKILRRSKGLSKKQIGILLGMMKKKAFLHRRLILWNNIHRLFHYWHVFHRPFALIMYLIMVIHVVLTVILGYTWIF